MAVKPPLIITKTRRNVVVPAAPAAPRRAPPDRAVRAWTADDHELEEEERFRRERGKSKRRPAQPHMRTQRHDRQFHE